MTKNEIISQVRTSLQDSDVSKVILFGSYSKGTQTEDSDIDLLVVTNDNILPDSFARKMEIKLKISSALHSLRKHADLDLIVHTKPMHEKFIELNSSFKREILSTGTIILKQTTKDWLQAAEDDLLAAKTLMNDSRLTHVAAFHCQQCLEKCFKAKMEELEKTPIKSHDLFRLQLAADILLSDNETHLMGIINEVYIDARYSGDLGLLPQGKPLVSEIESFIGFCDTVFVRIKGQLN